jgi:hypothetical protein
MLSPFLVFGSGVHRQWLCDRLIAEHGVASHAEALRDWGGLLRSVAGRLDIAHALDSKICEEMPTLQWERLVHAYCDAEDKGLPAHKSENVLRRVVAETLSDAEREVEPAVEFGKILELREVLGRHTISLNLDSLLLRERRGRLRFAASKGECLALTNDQGAVWFPHGSALKVGSVNFGLRDYGKLTRFWLQYFNQYKQTERRAWRKRERAWDRVTFAAVNNWVSGLPRQSVGSFIGHLMLAPLMIFGAGLRREEWGMWWVLNQRARNLARVPEHLRPQTVLVLKNCDTRLPFWSARPANINPIIVNDWQDGWARLIEWMSIHKSAVRD